METFVFDGSFEGLLTAIFDCYELKAKSPKLIAENVYEPSFLDDLHKVISDPDKAKRVWAGLSKKLSDKWQLRFYTAYLSEQPESFQHLLDFARYIFDNPDGAYDNFGHASVIAISQIDKSVNRERHRMKAFIRFQETSDGIFYAAVEPDFNVLPLISAFFKNRYADQKWIIYDLRRKYGLFYDLNSVSEVAFDEVPATESAPAILASDSIDEKEELFRLLWTDYFKSTNIPARKNTKLHLRHVPKRYWKYLTEKQQF